MSEVTGRELSMSESPTPEDWSVQSIRRRRSIHTLMYILMALLAPLLALATLLPMQNRPLYNRATPSTFQPTSGGNGDAFVAKNSPAPLDTLPTGVQQKLEEYAEATARYFVSPQANNLVAGLTHSWFGTGVWRENTGPGQFQERPSLARGYGSHVVVNEISLGFNVLAVAFKQGWLDYLPANQRYDRSWGQVIKGLQSLQALQTSGDPNKYVAGTFHRAYLTAVASADYRDRTTAELIQDSNNEQSSDDNALTYMNLLVLQGLAQDPSVAIPSADRRTIIGLISSILSRINLRRFVVNNQIVFNCKNGVPSQNGWDRLSTEGAPILAALLASKQIGVDEFAQIASSLENHPVQWPSTFRGAIPIDFPNFHSAEFMHGLRMFHGMPVTDGEFAGVSFFDRSTKPVTEAQIDFAQARGLQALGTHVMSQPLAGFSLLCEASNPNNIVRFAGNEANLVPISGQTLARATAPHAFFVPLARFRELNPGDVDQLLAWIRAYEGQFFHSGSDTALGWEAAIPWTPQDTAYSWVGSDGQRKYTDNGRPYEALNAAYIVLSIFDALNPDMPLSSFNAQKQNVGYITRFFDQGTPLPKVFTGAIVAESGGSTAVTEGGPTDSYTIRLTDQPMANVTITLTPNSQLSVAPTMLTFTAADWNVPRTVTVTAVNDAVAEGNHTGTITHSATSADVSYNGIAIVGITAAITDNWPKPNDRDTSRKVAASISQTGRKAK